MFARQLWDRSRNVQRWRRVQSGQKRGQGRVEEVGGDKVGVEGGVEEMRVEAGGVGGHQVGEVGRQVAGGAHLEGGVDLGHRRGGGGEGERRRRHPHNQRSWRGC